MLADDGQATAPAPAAAGSSLATVVQSVASRVAVFALAAVTGVLIAHTLQPAGRGCCASIATRGSRAIVLGDVAVERRQGSLWADDARRPFLTAHALVLGLLLGAVTAATSIALTLLGLMPTRSPLLCLALLAVPFGVATVNLTGIALLRSRVGCVNAGTVTAALVQCVPLMLLTLAGRLTVAAVITCWTVSVTVNFLVLLRGLRPFPSGRDPRLACRQLALGGRFHPGLVAFHLLMNCDVLLVNALDSVSAVGLYTVAVTLLYQTRMPAEVITQLALPRQATGDLRGAGEVTARTLRLNLVVSSVFIGALAAASPVLIPLVYGRSFTGSVAPLLALAPGTVALTLLHPVEQYLVRLARPVTMTSVAAGALGANVALNVALIPVWGATGAGLVSTVTYSLLALLEICGFVRSAGLPPSSLVPRAADVRSVLAPLTRAAGGLARPPGRTAGRTTPRCD